MENVIEIRDLTKDYKTGFWKKKTVRALDGLTLDVRGGQIFGFLGGNGAGKTTTIKILMGLLYPTNGSATILGKSIDDVTMHRRIGYCPENPYFYDYLSARELMNYFGELFGYGKSERNSRTEELLTLVGLEAKAHDRQLRKFSKGMLQRVGLAQSLINDPEIVFLDEPMSGLDPIGRREIRELIAGLRTQGKTVFMSTHILSDIEALCDEVTILRNGKLAVSGKLHELLASRDGQVGFEVTVTNVSAEQLRASFDGTADISEHAGGCIAQCANESDVERVLNITKSAGGKLISVRQTKQSLEDLFTDQHS
jgi:ABC-2 type transport system ATP-binding protein